MLDYQTDWKIIVLRKQYRKFIQNYDLHNPLWIGDACHQFQRESLFDGKLKVYLPTQFMDLQDSAAREKYPSKNRPQIIRTNDDKTVDFTFSLVGEIGFPLTARSVWSQIDRLFPRNVLYDTGAFKTENLEIIWLEYKSFSVEREVYNILFPVVSNREGVILGAFNCPFISYDIWKPCVLQIIRTIQG